MDMDQTKFRRAFTQIFTPNENTFDLIRTLKPSYKIGLLSNVSEWDFEYGIKPISVFDLFDAMSLSFEVGALKPDEEIYYDMLKKLDLAPEACVYIDDLLEFVQAAERIGLYGIHYTDHRRLISSLKKAGIYPG
jgi:putative hydrolase of the HAD superfamily